MMTFNEKLKSDLEVLYRVLARLKENDTGDKSIAVVSGMIDGVENFLEKEDAN